MTPRKITLAEIDEVKRQVILKALSFDVKTTAAILGYSERKVLDCVKDGNLTARSDNPGRKGYLITASSIMDYAKDIEIPEEFWQR